MAQPTRFEFDLPTVASSSAHLEPDQPTMTPPPTPKPAKFEVPTVIDNEVRELVKKHVEKLEREISDLRVITDAVQKRFNQDQIDGMTGKKKRINWTDKTKAETIETRYILGETAFDHLRAKNPGAYPGKTCLNETLRKNVKVEFGIIEDSFKLVEIKARSLHAKQKFAALVMDEIALKEMIEYDRANKCLVGTITMPSGDDATIDDGESFEKCLILYKLQKLHQVRPSA